MNIYKKEEAVLRKLPPVKRFKEYHLYCRNGKRLLDFYQEGGRAVLGYRPAGLSVFIKDVMDKGSWSPYPSIYEKRLISLLNDYLPGYRFHIFSSIERSLIYIAEKSGKLVRDLVMSDSAFPLSSSDYSLHRPYLDNLSSARFYIPVIPFPTLSGGAILAEKIDPEKKKSQEDCVRDILSPLVLSAWVKSYHILFSTKRNTMDCASVDTQLWEQNGPYLRSLLTEEAYKNLWTNALFRNILLPPVSFFPAIIPGKFSSGEWTNFLSLGRD